MFANLCWFVLTIAVAVFSLVCFLLTFKSCY